MRCRFPGLEVMGAACFLAALSGAAHAEDAQASQPEPDKKLPEERSPWLLLPLFSSNPKLGTAVGAMGG
jgi:hypothetical protein